MELISKEKVCGGSSSWRNIKNRFQGWEDTGWRQVKVIKYQEPGIRDPLGHWGTLDPKRRGFFSKTHLFINWKADPHKGEREEERVCPLLICSSMTIKTRVGLVQARSQELFQGLSCGSIEPRIWVMLCLFPRHLEESCIERSEVEQPGPDWCPYLIPTSQAEN